MNLLVNVTTHGVILLIVSAILSPYIRLPEPIPSVRLEFILALIFWGLHFASSLVGHPVLRWQRSATLRALAYIGISIGVSTLYSVWVRASPFVPRDLWEFAKVALYVLLIAFVARARVSSVVHRRLFLIALATLCVSAFVGFLQYFDVGVVNSVIAPYYAPTQMRGLLVHGRIVGTTPNPNEFGALMVLASSLALSGGLNFPSGRLRLVSWLSLPIFLLALGLTLSRTALVSLFVATVVIFVRHLGHANKEKRLRGYLRSVAILVVGAGVLFGLLRVMPDKALFRFAELQTFTEASSFQARIDRYWRPNFALWLESPVFGWGPGKAHMGTTVDNEWLLIARRYGVLGVIAFLSFFLFLLADLFRIQKRPGTPESVVLSVAMQGTTVGYMVFMSAAVVYHSLQLMPIFLVIVGLAYSTRNVLPGDVSGERVVRNLEPLGCGNKRERFLDARELPGL